MQFHPSTFAYIAILFIGLGLLIVIPSYMKAVSGKSSSRGQKIFLLLNRLLFIGLILLLLFEPHRSQNQERKEKMEVAILVDESLSMLFKDQDPQTRWSEVKKKVKTILGDLDSGYQPVLYTFGKETRLVEDLPDAPSASTSDLALALRDVAAKNRNVPLGAVIVLSDGRLTDRNHQEDAITELKQLQVPVHTIALGSQIEESDVAVRSAVIAQPLPFERRVVLDLELNSAGFDGMESVIEIQHEGRTVHRKPIKIDEGKQTVKIEFIAPFKGFQMFDVKVRPLTGERLETNNLQTVGLHVYESKIRILYMEGSHQDLEVFPREMAKDPMFEVDTFFVVSSGRKNRENYLTLPSLFMGDRKIYNVTHPEHGLSIDPKDIQEYDVIINSDIFKGAFTPEQIASMVHLVEEEGGGFVMVGGEKAFGAGDYDETLIDRILPVEIELSRDSRYERFQPSVTEYGWNHPIMQVGDNKEETRSAWDRVTPFQGLNLVDRVKPGAYALAIHPTRTNKYGNMVIWAIQQIGRGRSMAFTPDTTEAWGTDFQSRWGNNEDPVKYYRAFWSNSIRWLAADRISRKLGEWSINGPPMAIQGMPVNLGIQVLRKNLDERVSLEVLQPDGQVKTVPVSSVGDGVFQSDFVPDQPGNYIVTAKREVVEGGESQTYFLKHFFQSQEDNRELATTKSAPRNLKTIADATGGSSFAMTDSVNWSDLLKNFDARIVEYGEVSLWDRWWVLLLLLGLLANGWFLRRRWGFA